MMSEKINQEIERLDRNTHAVVLMAESNSLGCFLNSIVLCIVTCLSAYSSYVTNKRIDDATKKTDSPTTVEVKRLSPDDCPVWSKRKWEDVVRSELSEV